MQDIKSLNCEIKSHNYAIIFLNSVAEIGFHTNLCNGMQKCNFLHLACVYVEKLCSGMKKKVFCVNSPYSIVRKV